jgi:hypothetical protein
MLIRRNGSTLTERGFWDGKDTAPEWQDRVRRLSARAGMIPAAWAARARTVVALHAE